MEQDDSVNRCSHCGAPEPAIQWERIENMRLRSYVPLSKCCEARIVDPRGRELTADDLEG